MKISFKTPQHSKNYYFVSYELLEMVFITIYNHYFRYHYYGYHYNYEYIYILKETHQQNRNKWMESETIHLSIFVNISLLIYFGYIWIIVSFMFNWIKNIYFREIMAWNIGWESFLVCENKHNFVFWMHFVFDKLILNLIFLFVLNN